MRRSRENPALLLPSLRSPSQAIFPLDTFDGIRSYGSGTTLPRRRALTLRLSLNYGREHLTSRF